jgi:ferritin-like metal-binding protein YciE
MSAARPHVLFPSNFVERIGTMMHSLQDLYVDQLRDLFSAENQLLIALPKMISAANSPELQQALQAHYEETQEHVRRLQKIFADLGETPGGETCEAMEGLIAEGERTINTPGDPNVKDAALIAAAQRVEHYEISGYGTVKTFAKLLDYDDAADLLDDTLQEEGAADHKLTSVAEGGLFTAGINKKAEKSAGQ